MDFALHTTSPRALEAAAQAHEDRALSAYLDALDDAEEEQEWIDAAREPVDCEDVLQALVEDGTLSDVKIDEMVRERTRKRVQGRPERARNLIAAMGRLIDVADASLDRGDTLRTALADARQAWVQIGGMVPMTTYGGADAAREVGLPTHRHS